LQIKSDLPKEIIPGYFLKRANEIQIERINQFFFYNGHADKIYYGFIMNATAEDSSWGIEHGEKLNINTSRYFIIENRTNNFEFNNLSTALWLSSKKIFADIHFGFLKNTPTYGGNFISFHSYFNSFHFRKSVSESIVNKTNIVHEDDSKNVQENYHLIKKLDRQKYPFTGRAIIEYDNLRNIPIEAPVRKLIYFIIWECLLTHKPDPKDPTDSISRQLKGKIALVNNRLSSKINLSNYTDGAKLETIISALYQYRSDLIHSGYTSFSGKIKILESHENADNILDEITTKLIIGALKEPKLLFDLKRC